MVGRATEWSRLVEFVSSGPEQPALGIVWGRRRVGKSFLLSALVEGAHGFYYGAVRGSSGEALRELGERIGAWQGAAAALALETWDAAANALLALKGDRRRVVVLDEYPYLLEHTPELDSILQRAFGARETARSGHGTRLILCGSAMSVMRGILGGTAPLRGRAGLDLRISPFDFRIARELHGIEDLWTAVRTYGVIGGVAAYAREMTAGDLPAGPEDFDRWVCRRVLTPAAPLFGEVSLLLSEDPAMALARKPNLYHAALAGVATGHTTHRDLTSYVKIAGPSLAPILETLVAAEFVERVHDPIRDNRPTYHPADPLIRFHYAVIRRHASRLGRHDADSLGIWSGARPAFESRVLGPVFEAMARFWVTHFAQPEVIGGEPAHVGPTVVRLTDGTEREVDIVVASDDGRAPSDRTIVALGEAKAGIGHRHLHRLEEVRTALGDRATAARLLLFAVDFTPDLRTAAKSRADVELVGLDRLYGLT